MPGQSAPTITTGRGGMVAAPGGAVALPEIAVTLIRIGETAAVAFPHCVEREPR